MGREDGMPKNLQPINSFLTERKTRIKPDEANSSGLARIEKIDFSGTIHLAEGKDTKTDMILIKKGDLVISGINVAKGALAVYEGDDDVMATIHYSAYSFDAEKIDIEFLKWFLKSPAFVDALIDQTGGGIKTEIKAKKFLSLKIPLPSFEEQKQIELKLNSFQERHLNAVRELEKQAKLMTKLRASILMDAVSGRLVPQEPNDEPAIILLDKIRAEKERLIKEGKIKREKSLSPIAADEIPYELPEGLVWCRLGELLSLQNGYAFKSQYFTDSGVKLARNINIAHGRLNWQNLACYPIQQLEEYSSFSLQENDILISLDRPIISTGLKIAIVKKCDLPALLLQRVGRIKFDQLKINAQYLYLWFLSPLFMDEIDPGRSNGVPHISTKDIEMLQFPLPPLAEQHRIVAKVEQHMATCDALEAEVAKSHTETNRLMQTILKEAFENDKL